MSARQVLRAAMVASVALLSRGDTPCAADGIKWSQELETSTLPTCGKPLAKVVVFAPPTTTELLTTSAAPGPWAGTVQFLCCPTRSQSESTEAYIAPSAVGKGFNYAIETTTTTVSSTTRTITSSTATTSTSQTTTSETLPPGETSTNTTTTESTTTTSTQPPTSTTKTATATTRTSSSSTTTDLFATTLVITTTLTTTETETSTTTSTKTVTSTTSTITTTTYTRTTTSTTLTETTSSITITSTTSYTLPAKPIACAQACDRLSVTGCKTQNLAAGSTCNTPTVDNPCIGNTTVSLYCPDINIDPSETPLVEGDALIKCRICGFSAAGLIDVDLRRGYILLDVHFGPNLFNGKVEESFVSGYAAFLTNEQGYRLSQTPASQILSNPGAVPTYCCQGDAYSLRVVAKLPANVNKVRIEVVPVLSTGPLSGGMFTGAIADVSHFTMAEAAPIRNLRSLTAAVLALTLCRLWVLPRG